jgi:hypothetical protein
MSSEFLVSVSRVIDAPKQDLFDIVADPAQHTVLDGSGSVRQSHEGNPSRLYLGAEFGMGMRIVIPYKMNNTVVEFEEGDRIAWKPAGNYVWRYIFEQLETGTRVTEQWDARSTSRRFVMKLLGFPKKNRRGIEQTLRRLDDMARKR